MPLVPAGPHRYLLVDGDHTRVAYAARAEGGTRWVWLDGRVYTMKAGAPEATHSAHHDDASALMAPMPATVTRVEVAAGDHVSRGDVLVTLEAMKMELPIVAPRDGIVRSLACRVGELVQPGVPLVELE